MLTFEYRVSKLKATPHASSAAKATSARRIEQEVAKQADEGSGERERDRPLLPHRDVDVGDLKYRD